MNEDIRITALAGGVGGAKLADGLAKILSPKQLSIIVNTGDDFELSGLHISPDLDTVCYTLAGLANPVTGWGQVNETWEVFKTLEKLNFPHWFRLGDHDLAFHMERTRLLNTGLNLTDVTKILCTALGVKHRILPMSDDMVRTIVHTKDGHQLGFQEYFVREQCTPQVSGFIFDGIAKASISKEVHHAVSEADLIILCPSNPWVSIDPIIKLNGFLNLLKNKHVVAVSPIIGGKTLKGPAAKMFSELGITPNAIAVADLYRDFLSGFVLDDLDFNEAAHINDMGIMSLVTKIIMRSADDRVQLAKETLNFGLSVTDKG